MRLHSVSTVPPSKTNKLLSEDVGVGFSGTPSKFFRYKTLFSGTWTKILMPWVALWFPYCIFFLLLLYSWFCGFKKAKQILKVGMVTSYEGYLRTSCYLSEVKSNAPSTPKPTHGNMRMFYKQTQTEKKCSFFMSCTNLKLPPILFLRKLVCCNN